MKQFQIKSCLTPRTSDSLMYYLNEIAQYDVLSKEEEYELIKAAQKGDKKARNKLIEHNLRFVISLAKLYMTHGVPFEDLISVGNFGLFTAIDKFDTSLNLRFVSYAGWWIRQFIIEEIKKNHFIRLPGNKIDLINRINKCKEFFLKKTGCIPSDDEIIKFIGISKEEYEEFLNYSNIEVQSENIVTNQEETISLFETEIIDQEENELYNKISNKDLLNILSKVLTEEEYKITCLYFGLNGNSMSFLQIADELNISKEWVSKIKTKAINKLRNCPYTEILQQYV